MARKLIKLLGVADVFQFVGRGGGLRRISIWRRGVNWLYFYLGRSDIYLIGKVGRVNEHTFLCCVDW